MLPRSMAQSMANAQFGGAVRTDTANIGNQKAQSAQDLADIGNWFGQAQAANTAGSAASRTADQQAATSDTNNVAALLKAIGGGANAGAGQLAAEGAINSNQMNAQAANQANAGANMNTALAAQSAGASADQNALNNQAMQSLQQQLATDQAQRAAAVQTNLMQIIQANNATAQQRFQNKLSVLSANQSLALEPAQVGLANAQAREAQSTAAQASAKGRTHAPGQAWEEMSGADQLNAIKNWAYNGANKLVPQGKALALARAQLYTNPNVAQQIAAFYKAQGQ